MLTHTSPTNGSFANFEKWLAEPLQVMGVPLDQDTEDITGAAMDYALTVWLPAQGSDDEEPLSPEEAAAIANLGMSGPVMPPLDVYDGAILDGGRLPVLMHRLKFWDMLRDSGKLILELAMFGGHPYCP